jgi:polysaccharide biosynthesis protein PslH
MTVAAMRILILTPRPPWPPIDGGRVAMSRLAESLARAGAEVEVLSLNPRKHRADGTAPLPMRTIDIDTSRVLGPLFGRRPYIVERFVSDRFAAAMRDYVPDLVQVESPFMLPYASAVLSGGPRIVLRSLNVEFRIWESLARAERNPLRRFALRRVASSLRRYEIAQLNVPDAIVPISAADADDFRRLGCTRPMHVAPCGVTLPAVRDEPEPWRVGFIGSLDYRPNQEAVTWLIDELWPRVVAVEPRARLSIAGSSAPPWLVRRLAGVDFHGAVDDATAFMSRMSVIVAPLFAGGGMRIKVLEAMALGKPVVATRLGAGGIDGDDLVLADDTASFAEAVVRLLREPEIATRIGRAARAAVGERYDNDAIGRGVLAFYESLLSAPTTIRATRPHARP